MKYYDAMNKDESGTFVTFSAKHEAEAWMEEQKRRFPERVERDGIHIVENEQLTPYERAVKAYAIANNAIYFSDSSDYLPALYQICRMLMPREPEENIGQKFIEE
jgi:hypothetical protein